MKHIRPILVLLSIFISLPGFHSSEISSRIITGKRTCLSQSECHSSQYCNTDTFSKTSFTCVLLLKKNDRCNTYLDYQCQRQLHCSVKGSKGDVARCQPGSKRNEPCDPQIQNSCAGFPYDTCSRDSKTCIQASVGKMNEKCKSGGCNKGQELYCNNSVCRKQHSLGGDCSKYADSCDGSTYCHSPFLFAPKFVLQKAMCVKASDVGQKCLSDKHCKGRESVCIVQSGGYGTCIYPSQRITKPGASCNTKLDTCDRRRGLSCQRFQGRYVCMQRATYRSNFRHWTTPYCTPNNKFSHCMPYFGRPTECRLPSSCEEFPQCNAAARQQADTRTIAARGYILPTPIFPSCLGEKKFLGQGALCNIHESEVCGTGLHCSFVPVVKEQLSNSSPKRTSHCVKVIKYVNGDCSDPFQTKCETGMSCVDGRCLRGRKSFKLNPNQKTHLGIHSTDRCDTSKLPCAPGLECDKQSRRCERPKKMVKKGSVCYDVSSYRVVCEKGTVCRFNSNGEGLLRCLDPLNVGESCDSHGDCRNGLRCSKNLMKGKKCFNPKKSLKQGDSCNPNASSDENQCVESLNGPFSSFELKCLKNKQEKFVCHRLIRLGNVCNVDKNKPDACDEGLSCVRHGKYDVCVGKFA